MDSLRSAWFALDSRRRVIVVLATVAVFAAVLGLARMGGVPTPALLYAGLDAQSAGGVIAALDQRGVVYEVRGDAIYVPATDRDALRLSLAGEGLPAGGAQGYELLDSLSGFGTTAQMFDAAYWRAKEGELARTILAVPGVQSARVHISTPTNRPFQREQATTAAVSVAMGAGMLSAEQAQALRFLVASSVSGLAPENVTIIDAAGGLIPAEGSDAGSASRAEELRERAANLLQARVGFGNAVVEVSVETVTDTESIVERRIDPESRTAVATEVEERSATAQDQGQGAVTVASNLPDGDAAEGGSGSQSQDSETRTTTNYDLSETSRELLRGPGAIRRMTVAVLVNDIATTAEDGTVTVAPRSEEELAALRDLVASAVGLDEARGDVITIRSMPFEPLAVLGTEAGAAATGFPLDMMQLIRLAVLAAVALILGLFVVRPILSSGSRTPQAELAALPAPDQSGGAGDTMVLPQMATMDGAPPMLGGGDGPGFFMAGGDFDPGAVAEAEEVDPVTRLRRLISERQDETLQILQNWIEETDDKEPV